MEDPIQEELSEEMNKTSSGRVLNIYQVLALSPDPPPLCYIQNSLFAFLVRLSLVCLCWPWTHTIDQAGLEIFLPQPPKNYDSRFVLVTKPDIIAILIFVLFIWHSKAYVLSLEKILRVVFLEFSQLVTICNLILETHFCWIWNPCLLFSFFNCFKTIASYSLLSKFNLSNSLPY